jgi:hypothetical protein
VNNYGISQNPNTKVYILVFNDKYCDYYCKKCGNKYENGWCKPCQLKYLKDNFENWTSGNVKLDEFIQKKQLEINKYDDLVFEWIPYDEFLKTGKDSIAIWKNGPLYYNVNDKKLIRNLCEKVYLKYLHDSQDVNDEFLNMVLKFFL